MKGLRWHSTRGPGAATSPGCPNRRECRPGRPGPWRWRRVCRWPYDYGSDYPDNRCGISGVVGSVGQHPQQGHKGQAGGESAGNHRFEYACLIVVHPRFMPSSQSRPGGRQPTIPALTPRKPLVEVHAAFVGRGRPHLGGAPNATALLELPSRAIVVQAFMQTRGDGCRHIMTGIPLKVKDGETCQSIRSLTSHTRGTRPIL